MHYELSFAVRRLLAVNFERDYKIQYENVDFVPPKNGGTWLKYDYKESDTIFLSLDRKCRSYIGMVQIAVIFPPGSGIDEARKTAKDIADFFDDGKMISSGYIYEGAKIHPVQKSETGWFYPVRFYVRFDEKREV